MPSNVLGLLVESQKLIAEPSAWTQREPARDEHGNPVRQGSPKAVKWCSLGALAKLAPGPNQFASTVEGFLNRAARGLGYNDAVHLNDTATHTLVMQMFDSAIVLAKKEHYA